MKDDFGIGVGPYMSELENLEKLGLNLKAILGIFDTKLCHMGRELDPRFSKLSNSLG